jgi:hypothetical protein
MQHLLDKVKKRGFSDDDIVRVAASQGDQLLDKFADVIAQSARKPQESYPVVVNYDLSVEEAVEAGNYQAVNADITHEHFSWKQKGQIAAEIVLVRFEHRMTSQGVIDELENEGLRPAELPEILAFGAQYPEVQRKFSVVGLGSIWQDRKGSRNVPCLYEASEGRYLDLHWWDDGWYAYSRFAALRK